jgi:hypothetical protein
LPKLGSLEHGNPGVGGKPVGLTLGAMGPDLRFVSLVGTLSRAPEARRAQCSVTGPERA